MIPIPEEIWRQIFSNYECVLTEEWWLFGTDVDRSSRETLRSLCLTSTQFCRLAQPLLYRTIPLEGRVYDSMRYQGNLVRTLMASPELRLHTRAISLDEKYREIDHDFRDNVLLQRLPSLALPPAVRRHIRDELESENFNHSFDTFTNIGIAPFILALTPRVRLVDLTYHGSKALLRMLSGRADLPDRPARELGDSREHGEGGEPRQGATSKSGGQGTAGTPYSDFGLPDLEEVRLRAGDVRRWTRPIHHVEHALLHPGLRTLRLFATKWLRESLELLRWPAAPRGVRHLELREAVVDGPSFRHILTNFTGLRTFLVHMGGPWRVKSSTHDEVEWDCRLDDIGSALRDLGGGLAELDLHTNGYFKYRGEAARRGGVLGSLREMRALRRLSVVYDDLVAERSTQAPEQAPAILAEVLPPSLETLHLHWDGQYLDEESYRRRCVTVNLAVRGLLEQGSMPNLRQVSIERYDNKTLEGEFDGPVAGWDMTVESKHLWSTYFTVRHRRTIVTFERTG